MHTLRPGSQHTKKKQLVAGKLLVPTGHMDEPVTLNMGRIIL
jgi:hypothetical protein